MISKHHRSTWWILGEHLWSMKRWLCTTAQEHRIIIEKNSPKDSYRKSTNFFEQKRNKITCLQFSLFSFFFLFFTWASFRFFSHCVPCYIISILSIFLPFQNVYKTFYLLPSHPKILTVLGKYGQVRSKFLQTSKNLDFEGNIRAWFHSIFIIWIDLICENKNDHYVLNRPN